VDRLPGPRPTVDVIIETPQGIVCVDRKYPPHGWAFPGGHVDEGEFVADAARRECLEETGLEVELLELLGVYSDPQRDSRYHTIAVVYIGRATGTPRGGDDALRAEAFAPGSLPKLIFDHDVILKDYFRYREHGERPPLRR
jgi:8-oxo-dGTP diphosphatase